MTSLSLFRTDHNFYGFQQMSWFLELSFHVMGLLKDLLPKEPEGMPFFFCSPGSRAYFSFLISSQSFCFNSFIYLFCPWSLSSNTRLWGYIPEDFTTPQIFFFCFYTWVIFELRYQQAMAHGPNIASCVFLWIKFYWDTVMPIHWCIIYVCFQTQ